MTLTEHTLTMTEQELLEAVESYWALSHGRAEIKRVMVSCCAHCEAEKGRREIVPVTHGICQQHKEGILEAIAARRLTPDAKALVGRISDPQCEKCNCILDEDTVSGYSGLCNDCYQAELPEIIAENEQEVESDDKAMQTIQEENR